MDSDAENRMLNELERQFAREDPAFVNRMRADAKRAARLADGLALGAGLYVLIPIVMLLTGWAGVAVTLGVAAAIAAFCRYRDARRPGPGAAVRSRGRGAGAGTSSARPDALFVGGPSDGDVFVASGATLVEVPTGRTWHRYVPTSATRSRGDRTLTVYNYAGEIQSSGPAGSDVRLHGTPDD
jgi:hypothetical protein